MALQDTTNTNMADSGRMTPETIARRQKVLDAMFGDAMKPRPIRHWAEGLAQMAQTGVAGWQLGKLQDAEKANAADSASAIKDAFSTVNAPQASSITTSADPKSFSSGGVTAAPTTGKIYSNDEPSPLDPPSGADRDKLARTVLAEAGNQGPTGMNAVASVARNRAVNGGFGGDTPTGVVTARNQFEPWNTDGGRAKMAGIDPSSPEYTAAGRAIDSAYAGNDPTNGATHFYSPKAQSALGRPAPSWDNGTGVDIGGHRFFGGAPRNAVAEALTSQPPYQVAGPAVAGPQAPTTQPAAPQTQTDKVASALSSTPTPGGSSQQQAAPDFGKLIAAVSNPYISTDARHAAMTVLQSQLAQNKVQTVDLGNAVGIMDQRGNIIRSIPKGEPNKGPTFEGTGEFDLQTGKEVKGWIDPRTKSVAPYRPQGAAPAQPSVIPAVPSGVDPDVWRKAQSERVTSDAMTADDKSTSALRNEIQGLPSYKNLAQASPVFNAMKEAAARDNRAADVNLIYGLGKIMDPGSVVRESEMTMAQKIATLPQYLQAAAGSQLTGSGRLTPELRQQILEEAHGRIQSYKGMFDQDANMYRGIAGRRRMNAVDVLPDFGEFTPWQPATPAQPQAAPQGGSWTDIDPGVRIREKR